MGKKAVESPSKEKPSKTTRVESIQALREALKSPGLSSVALNQDATDKLGVLDESESMLLWSLAAPPTKMALLAATVHPSLLQEAAKTASKQEAKRIAGNPHTPSQVLQNLEAQPDLSNLLANNPNTPEPTLLLLLKKGELDVASNPNLSAHEIDQLMSESRLSLQRALARNPSISEQHLKSLTRVNDLTTKLSILENPNASEALYDILAHDRAVYEHFYGDFGFTKPHDQRPDWLVRRRGILAPREKLRGMLIKGGLIATPTMSLLLWAQGIPSFGAAIFLSTFLSVGSCVAIWQYTGSDGTELFS